MTDLKTVTALLEKIDVKFKGKHEGDFTYIEFGYALTIQFEFSKDGELIGYDIVPVS